MDGKFLRRNENKGGGVFEGFRGGGGGFVAQDRVKDGEEVGKCFAGAGLCAGCEASISISSFLVDECIIPSTSFPSSNKGMAFVWTGVGPANFSLFTACRSRASRPRLANVDFDADALLLLTSVTASGTSFSFNLRFMIARD